MPSLIVVAPGNTKSVQAQARGALFEDLVAILMRHTGFDVPKPKANVTHAGMEIDIEGHAVITRIPIYAECKCYSSAIPSEKLQAFVGKYMPLWSKNKKCQAVFVAIPGLNSHAKGYYKDHCEHHQEMTIRLLEEPQVVESLISGKVVVSESVIASNVDADECTPGDSAVVYCDKGFFWLQYIIPKGSGIASQIRFFDPKGSPVHDDATIDYLLSLMPELRDLSVQREAPVPVKTAVSLSEADAVVELRGSSSCFEYQFPAAPEHFVGRLDILESIRLYIEEILSDDTSSRGLLFEGNSGWGKSSLALTAAARLRDLGHYALVLDARSATSSQFIPQAVTHLVSKYGSFDGALPLQPIVTGADGAIEALCAIGTALAPRRKLLIIFFDQFENVFFTPSLLTRIANLCLKLQDVKTNVVLGFCWKADLVGLTRDFPYRWRDIIAESCRVFHLKQFSELETNELLDRLSAHFKTPLRKDLRFLLPEFSQGYPWLLKKLCAHVLNLHSHGVQQAEIARNLLNVEQLFLEDLEGLSAEQEGALRQIAKSAPVDVRELGEEFAAETIQALVHRRLVVKVGSKYDIYWDIFRDYLNTGQLPIQEAYLLRAQVGSILNAVSILYQHDSALGVYEFKRAASLSDGAFLNVARDLRLLGIADVEEGALKLLTPALNTEKETLESLSAHLSERLMRNRSVHTVLAELESRGRLSLDEIVDILREQFPYISARQKTWSTYARVLANWLDMADLAIRDEGCAFLSKFCVGQQVRERTLTLTQRRSGLSVPPVHFAPVVEVAMRLVTAIQTNELVDWSDIQRSTIYKALSTLEEMNLIERRSKTIVVLPDCREFALDAKRRSDIAILTAMGWPVFKTFIDILTAHSGRKLSHRQLGELLCRTGLVSWKQPTAQTNAKIMLDWARHLGVAPGAYRYSARGRFRSDRHAQAPLLFDMPSEHNQIEPDR